MPIDPKGMIPLYQMDDTLLAIYAITHTNTAENRSLLIPHSCAAHLPKTGCTNYHVGMMVADSCSHRIEKVDDDEGRGWNSTSPG